MSDLLDQIIKFAQDIVHTGSYPGIAFVMFLENIFPPIPSEVIMPLAGFLVAEGKLNIVPVLIAGIIGPVVGAVVLYYLSLWAGEPFMRAMIRRYGRWFTISEADLDSALAYFEKRGEWVIFFGRCIPIIRTLISIPAGMNRMPMPRFLFFTTLGTAIWSGVLTLAGYVLGEEWKNVTTLIERYQSIVIVLIALVIIWLAFTRFQLWRDRRQTSENA